jgi:hypothetical protein
MYARKTDFMSAMPTTTIGLLTVSRFIVGGNPFSGD